MKFLLPSSEGIIKHGPSYLQRGYYPFTVLIVPEEVTSHRSVFMSQKGLLKSEAPDGFMRKDLVRQGSCHFTSWSWHSSHCTAHGALEEVGRIWPSFVLSAFSASMCILPSPGANISNKLLALGKSWGREATGTHCIRLWLQKGNWAALGVPLLESKGKDKRKERPQEINKHRREPRHALECGLYPEDMKTQVRLLLASRESKANDWRPGRRGVSISRTNSTWSLNQNIVIGSDIKKQKLFLNMSGNDPTYLKTGCHWAPGKQNSSRQSYLTPYSRCFWSFMADNHCRFPTSKDV